MPRTAARKDYTLFVMCDSWIGADQLVPLKLKVRTALVCVCVGLELRCILWPPHSLPACLLPAADAA